jgi:hypothetical protein
MFRSIFKLPRVRRPQSTRPPTIRSRWVETADERCPIACTWFLAPDVLEQDAEPGSTWPAFLLRKAGFPRSFVGLLRPQPQTCR